MARRSQAERGDPYPEDRHPEKPERDERMTKNKTREGPLPPADKGVNDARPGLPTPTARKSVTWVQPEPTASDVTLPQQLSPDTTWAQPSIAKSILTKGSPWSRPTPIRRKSSTRGMIRYKYVYWCISHQQCIEPSARKKLRYTYNEGSSASTSQFWDNMNFTNSQRG